MWGIIGGVGIIAIVAVVGACALAWRRGFDAGAAAGRRFAPSYAQGATDESIRLHRQHDRELATLRTSWMQKVEDARAQGYNEGWDGALAYIQTTPVTVTIDGRTAKAA